MIETAAGQTGPVGDGNAVVDGVDVDAVTAAVLGCPGVCGTYAGAMSEVTTLLPGRRVPGVRIRADELVVEVVAHWGVTAAEVATQLRSALRPLAGGHRLHVVIADIAEPADCPTSTSGEESRVDS